MDTKKLQRKTKEKNRWDRGALRRGKPEGVTSQRCQLMGINVYKVLLDKPPHPSPPTLFSCGYFRDPPVQFWCWEWVNSCRLRAPAPFYSCEDGNHNNSTSTACIPPPLYPPRSVFIFIFFVIIPFCFSHSRLKPLSGVGAGVVWMCCCWRECKDAEGHT